MTTIKKQENDMAGIQTRESINTNSNYSYAHNYLWNSFKF